MKAEYAHSIRNIKDNINPIEEALDNDAGEIIKEDVRPYFDNIKTWLSVLEGQLLKNDKMKRRRKEDESI